MGILFERGISPLIAFPFLLIRNIRGAGIGEFSIFAVYFNVDNNVSSDKVGVKKRG